jgi:DNA polymerase-4
MIAHADMDAFYASVEQLDNPELRGKAIVVGGSSRRGVVTSASYEARKFGVRAAMPTAQAHKLCPHAIFVPGRMDRYVEISRQLRTIFESFTPVVEPISLDEAFLDLGGTERLLGPPLETAKTLKRRVLDETGLVVSIGIAPTKMVAKILSDMSKPDGLMMLDSDYVLEFLAPLPVERLWGVGPVTLASLHSFGVSTIGDLRTCDAGALRSRLGSMGPHLRELAEGRDSRHVEGDWQRKSYGEENTFDEDLATDALKVKRTLIAHGEAIARRLRADSVTARTITLKLKLARPLGGGKYPLVTRSFSLDQSSDDGDLITKIAIGLLAKAPRGEKIRLAGVQVHNLERQNRAQLGLFETKPGKDGKRTRLNLALDEVNKRFGENALSRGLARAERAAPTTRIK